MIRPPIALILAAASMGAESRYQSRELRRGRRIRTIKYSAVTLEPRRTNSADFDVICAAEAQTQVPPALRVAGPELNNSDTLTRDVTIASGGFVE